MIIRAQDLKVFQSYLGMHTLGYMIACMYTNVNYNQLLIILSFYDSTMSWFALMASIAAIQVIVPWVTNNYGVRFWANFISALAWGGMGFVQSMNAFFTPLIPLSILFLAGHAFIALRLRCLNKVS